MANSDIVNGFKPVRHLDGRSWNGGTRMYLHMAADGVEIFPGDLVKSGGTAGAAGLTVYGVDCEGMQSVVQAAAGDTLLVGGVVGVLPNPDILSGSGSKHVLASTNRIVLVCDDPSVVYEVQSDGDTTPLVAADIGENCDIIVAAGNTTTGASGMEIDDTTHTTATAQIRVLGLVKRPDNALGANAKYEVVINEHAYKSTTGT